MRIIDPIIDHTVSPESAAKGPRRNLRRGFTLIESLIATVVLAFCVMGVCGVLMASIENGRGAESESLAAEWARSNMERLAAKKLNDISPAIGNETTENIHSSHFVTGDDVTVTGTVTYLNRPPTPATRDVAILSVTVQTADGNIVTLRRLASRTEMR